MILEILRKIFPDDRPYTLRPGEVRAAITPIALKSGVFKPLMDTADIRGEEFLVGLFEGTEFERWIFDTMPERGIL